MSAGAGSSSGMNKAIGSSSGVNKAVGGSSGGQFNRTGGLKCFGCGEIGHRKSECRKTSGKSALFMDTDGYAEDELEFEGQPVYDREEATEEMHLEGDVGTALVVRRSYFTPKASSEEPWLRSNIFQSTCTIKDKVCRFVIDGGSCENIVSVEAVQKLDITTENHPRPYKLAWLKKGGEVTVSKRDLVTFSVGAKYKDTVWCDVVAMDAFHLLLGRP